MEIIVCVKQVPNTAKIKIDPVRNTLVRSGVPSILNPSDRNALETALRVKDANGAHVTVVTMGPPQASAVLREALSLGADRAVLVTDRAFGGSDTFATSHILSAVVRHLGGADLVLGGVQAIDGDTGQTIPSLAAQLGAPVVSHALSLDVDGTNVVIVREVEEGTETVRGTLPLLVTVSPTANKPRYASIESKLASLAAGIEEVGFDALAEHLDAAHIGLKGSPTRVKSTYVPPRAAEGKRIPGITPDELATALVSELATAKII